MISGSQLRKLAHFKSASWALWSQDFNGPHCLESAPEDLGSFFAEHAARLNPGVVLLGLNRSRDDDRSPRCSFSNFHAMRHRGDLVLKHYIQDKSLASLQGAYMTDINATDVRPDGRGVRASGKDLKQFLKQLLILGQASYSVICFGTRAFDVTTSGLASHRRPPVEPNIRVAQASVMGIMFTIFGVWHYSDRGFNHNRVQELRNQLTYLNSRLASMLDLNCQ